MKKILLIASENFATPTSGYQLCVYNRYQALINNGFDIDVIIFKDNNTDDKEKANIHVRKKVNFHNLIKCIFKGQPFFSMYYEGEKFIEEVLSSTDYNAVIYEGLTSTALYDERIKIRFEKTKFVYCAHNVEYLLVNDIYKKRKGAYLLRHYLQWSVKKYEKKLLSLMDEVVTLSNSDSEKLNELLPREILTSGIHFSPINFVNAKLMGEHGKKIILLPTNFTHPPNLESFTKVVIPLSLSLGHEYEIVVTGKDDGYFNSHKFTNIKYMGLVDKSELDRLYSLAYCSLNPTISGGGVQIKLYEPLMYGCPVVTMDFNLQDTLLGQYVVESHSDINSTLSIIGSESRKSIYDSFYKKNEREIMNWVGIYNEII
ncbi:glycosyltransferase [Pseudocolwellia sp. AS88]|uniref:glycosyltransferase n=1 Tax=Pseudocolwellia sp. AS88 TaxID=3063958 RepID=UPI0026F1CB4F|nr:glycosyltransferase [Pseudocolwellia sp. AS88]MDO7085026.1 glycosyltransferase [Pseudocolwellia sp. AS88]